jgi:hypothetical protein
MHARSLKLRASAARTYHALREKRDRARYSEAGLDEGDHRQGRKASEELGLQLHLERSGGEVVVRRWFGGHAVVW